MATSQLTLLLAARHGDVDFLRQAIQTQPQDYFLTRVISADGGQSYNFVHIAVLNEGEEFLREALSCLPFDTVITLLSHEDESYYNFNAFHHAVLRGNQGIVRLLVEYWNVAYSRESSSSDLRLNKPSWSAKDTRGMTPLHVALCWGNEACALQMLDILGSEMLYNEVDNTGSSPLFLAVRNGHGQVALRIMNSNHPYSTSGEVGLSPLDVAPYCSEEVCRLILQQHPEMISNIDAEQTTILQRWVMIGRVWPFRLLINRENTSAWRREFINLMCRADTMNGHNPLHIAAYSRTNEAEVVEVVQLLVQAYIDAYEAERGEVHRRHPWKEESVERATPLILALLARRERLALYYLSVDLENLVIYASLSALFYAVDNGCNQVVHMILTSVDETRFRFVKHTEVGSHVLHVASKCTEGTGRMLVERFPSLINEPDRDGKRPLNIASEVGSAWLIRLLLTKDPTSITRAPNAWITACEKGHLSAIDAFMNHCQDFRRLCLEQRDTPLHHIRLRTYTEYQSFVAIPLINEMKNALDLEGATPLHRAIEHKDIVLAEVLLTAPGVDRNIRNTNAQTATDLLAYMCHHDTEWDVMCQRIQINPRLRRYILPPTLGSGGGSSSNSSVGEMRATLSVVAALLATLTFAAGFTLPGGFNQDTGEALMPTKAAFLVFLLTDTYAMCCSMLVLFCLIWSMVCDPNMTILLIDRSVVILMQALYGTLVAFMTGLYTVVSHKSLWAAIIICIMCSLVGVSANRSILYKVIQNVIPSPGKGNQSQAQSIGQGNASTSGASNSQNATTGV